MRADGECALVRKILVSGPTINQAAYTYNGVGNRTSLTDRRGIQNFGYDRQPESTDFSLVSVVGDATGIHLRCRGA